MTEHSPGLDELHSLVVRLHGMLTDRQPGLSSWRETVSQFCLAIGDFGGIGKVSAMPDLLTASKALRELLFQLAGSPLELAAKYGPDWEPPDAEHCRRVAHKADAAVARAEAELPK